MAKGKYQHVMDRLKIDLGTEPEYQVKVEKVKAKVLESLPLHATALARRYIEIRTQKDKLKGELESVQLELTAVEQLMAAQYEAEGVTSMNVEGLGTVRVTPEPKAKIVDRDAFREWCIENGYERALALPWSTTNAVLKQRLLEGLTEPSGLEARYQNGIFFTKAK